MLQYYPN